MVAHLVLQLQLEEIVEVGKFVNERRVHGGDCLLVDGALDRTVKLVGERTLDGLRWPVED